MGMKKLIKHIMEVHKGISPIYAQNITSKPKEIAKVKDPIFSL